VAKLILLSIVVVSMVVPIALSNRPTPRRALRRAQWIIFAYIFVWALMSIFVYPELVPVE
jgi:hypothetical protein